MIDQNFRNIRYNSLLESVIIKFNRGPQSKWKNIDFEELSIEIFECSKIKVSKSTLKRIFGNINTSNNYFPQPSTMDALKIYCSQIIEKKSDTPPEFVIVSDKKSKTFLLVRIHRWILILLLLFLVERKNNHVELELEKIESVSSYGTAHFNINTNEIKDSIFFIDGDKRLNSKVYIPPLTRQIREFYDHPGYYSTYLMTNNKVISDVINVLIESNGWEMFITYLHLFKTDRFTNFGIKEHTKNGIFHINNQELKIKGIDTKRPIINCFENYKTTNEIGDNFEFEINSKLSDTKNATCNFDLEINIIGRNSNICVRLGEKKSLNNSILKASEKTASIKSTILFEFLNNFTDFNNIKIINKSKHINLYLGDNLILQEKYKQSLGNLIGISISFCGNGSLKKVILKNDYKTIFEF